MMFGSTIGSTAGLEVSRGIPLTQVVLTWSRQVQWLSPPTKAEAAQGTGRFRLSDFWVAGVCRNWSFVQPFRWLKGMRKPTCNIGK